MSYHTTIPTNALDSGWILAPERYDPRRVSKQKGSVLVGDVAIIVSQHAVPENEGQCVVLDTTHAVEGFIRMNPSNSSNPSVKSTKKRLLVGDVIVSRLRPYLRQIAYVPESLPTCNPAEAILCSTEFHVLRSTDGRNIAFLVPFLLSETPQQVFNAAQEGGHHPRFNADTLLGLPIPDSVLARREEVAAVVCEQARMLGLLQAEFAGLVASIGIR